MARRFTELAFTESVKAAQERYGSRAAVHGLERTSEARDRLGEAEAAFIAARDGFYLATVGENGWPYVQFRGGPAGFLRVLDERTLGYADFRGNRQYISAGNLLADGRAALILMDYATPRRLKIWAQARIVDAVEDAALAEGLAVPGYPGRVERAMLLAVEAFDWNCPQHITPRFTEAEVLQAVAPLRRRVDELEAELARLRAAPAGAS
jgi:predicted pyridoxine 5'-phosphate oxidase superfamily flavin-nucleotide-binding protein